MTATSVTWLLVNIICLVALINGRHVSRRPTTKPETDNVLTSTSSYVIEKDVTEYTNHTTELPRTLTLGRKKPRALKSKKLKEMKSGERMGGDSDQPHHHSTDSTGNFKQRQFSNEDNYWKTKGPRPWIQKQSRPNDNQQTEAVFEMSHTNQPISSNRIGQHGKQQLQQTQSEHGKQAPRTQQQQNGATKYNKKPSSHPTSQVLEKNRMQGLSKTYSDVTQSEPVSARNLDTHSSSSERDSKETFKNENSSESASKNRITFPNYYDKVRPRDPYEKQTIYGRIPMKGYQQQPAPYKMNQYNVTMNYEKKNTPEQNRAILRNITRQHLPQPYRMSRLDTLRSKVDDDQADDNNTTNKNKTRMMFDISRTTKTRPNPWHGGPSHHHGGSFHQQQGGSFHQQQGGSFHHQKPIGPPHPYQQPHYPPRNPYYPEENYDYNNEEYIENCPPHGRRPACHDRRPGCHDRRPCRGNNAHGQGSDIWIVKVKKDKEKSASLMTYVLHNAEAIAKHFNDSLDDFPMDELNERPYSNNYYPQNPGYQDTYYETNMHLGDSPGRQHSYENDGDMRQRPEFSQEIQKMKTFVDLNADDPRIKKKIKMEGSKQSKPLDNMEQPRNIKLMENFEDPRKNKNFDNYEEDLPRNQKMNHYEEESRKIKMKNNHEDPRKNKNHEEEQPRKKKMDGYEDSRKNKNHEEELPRKKTIMDSYEDPRTKKVDNYEEQRKKKMDNYEEESRNMKMKNNHEDPRNKKMNSYEDLRKKKMDSYEDPRKKKIDNYEEESRTIKMKNNHEDPRNKKMNSYEDQRKKKMDSYEDQRKKKMDSYEDQRKKKVTGNYEEDSNKKRIMDDYEEDEERQATGIGAEPRLKKTLGSREEDNYKKRKLGVTEEPKKEKKLENFNESKKKPPLQGFQGFGILTPNGLHDPEGIRYSQTLDMEPEPVKSGNNSALKRSIDDNENHNTTVIEALNSAFERLTDNFWDQQKRRIQTNSEDNPTFEPKSSFGEQSQFPMSSSGIDGMDIIRRSLIKGTGTFQQSVPKSSPRNNFLRQKISEGENNVGLFSKT